MPAPNNPSDNKTLETPANGNGESSAEENSQPDKPPAKVVTDTEELHYQVTGKVSEKYTLKDGMRQGEALIFNFDGEVTARENYKEDVLDGPCHYYRNGNIVETVNYKKGVVSQRTYYHSNGQVSRSVKLVNGNIQGEVVSYDEAGKPLQKEAYKGNQLNGVTTYYDGKGRASEQASYRQGKLEGPLATYSNGVLQAKMKFKQGQLASPIYSYKPDGKLYLVQNLKDGQPHGETLIYDDAEQLHKKLNYINGLLQGPALEYFPGGKQLKQRSQYHNNELHGELIEYYKNGNVKERRFYKAGQPVGQIVSYDPEGKEKEDQAVPKSEPKKSWWQRFIDWLLGEEVD